MNHWEYRVRDVQELADQEDQGDLLNRVAGEEGGAWEIFAIQSLDRRVDEKSWIRLFMKRGTSAS